MLQELFPLEKLYLLLWELKLEHVGQMQHSSCLFQVFLSPESLSEVYKYYRKHFFIHCLLVMCLKWALTFCIFSSIICHLRRTRLWRLGSCTVWRLHHVWWDVAERWCLLLSCNSTANLPPPPAPFQPQLHAIEGWSMQRARGLFFTWSLRAWAGVWDWPWGFELGAKADCLKCSLGSL